jgi:hypothetical protein
VLIDPPDRRGEVMWPPPGQYRFPGQSVRSDPEGSRALNAVYREEN